MQLPFLSKKQDHKEYFLALILSSGKISSILFEKTGNNLITLSTHSVEFHELLETLPSDRLIELSDVVISEIESKLPQGVMLTKTIFAVPQSWVIDGKIEKEHLSNLKRLCDALQLTPIGFMVSIEAIVAFLYKKEGIQVTALFVELGQKHATVTLVKSGNILSVHTAAIEEDSITTVEKLFAQQTDVDVLPAKIILLNYEHAHKTQQLFLGHSWKKDLPFLHIPQVVVLDPQIESSAVISGVALQMGFENLTNLVLLDRMSDPRENISDLEFTGATVGFFKDIDVLKSSVSSPRAHTDMDIIEDKIKGEHQHEEQEVIEDVEGRDIPIHHASKKIPLIFPSLSVPSFKIFSTMFPYMITKLPGGKAFAFPIIGFIIIVVGIIGYYFFYEKVQVNVTLDKKQISKDIEVSFSTEQETSVGNNVIHINSKSIQVEGQDQKDVTGKKETGEKAKGGVIILSSQNKEQVIEKGTILTSSNSLKFVLDSNIKIASSSGISDVKSAKGEITAEEIGKEYNLPSNTKFSVAGFNTSSVEAKNDSAFSGGNKKEIKVFSVADQTSLSTKIEENLSKKAIADFSAQKEEDEIVIPVALSAVFDEKDFSKKVGDEATSVSLTAKLTYDLGVYNKNDVVDFIKEMSEDNTSSDYKYSDKDSTISVQDIKMGQDGVPQGKLQFSAIFLPQVKTSELAGKLVGKSSKNASDIIQGKGIVDVAVVFLRSLPFFPHILPFNKQNIEILVSN